MSGVQMFKVSKYEFVLDTLQNSDNNSGKQTQIDRKNVLQLVCSMYEWNRSYAKSHLLWKFI